MKLPKFFVESKVDGILPKSTTSSLEFKTTLTVGTTPYETYYIGRDNEGTVALTKFIKGLCMDTVRIPLSLLEDSLAKVKKEYADEASKVLR